MREIMKCPVCSKEMTEEDFGGVLVDVCEGGCKGIWFDWVELIKLDEENEGFGDALQQACNHPRVNDENRKKIACPKCGVPMHIHKYQSSKQVNVDECYACGGFFLDSGELQVVRDTHMSEQEREEYCQSLLKGIPDYQQAKQDLEKMKTRNEAIRKYTKFMRPSYYVTGK